MTENRKVTEKGVISNISGGGSVTPFKGEWVTGTRYSKSQQVTNNLDLFICLINHLADSSNEPGVGVDASTIWFRQADSLTPDQIAACVGEGTPSASNKFATKIYVDQTSFCVSGTAGEALDAYDVVYAKDDGKYYLATANGTTLTADAIGIVTEVVV